MHGIIILAKNGAKEERERKMKKLEWRKSYLKKFGNLDEKQGHSTLDAHRLSK